MAIGRLRVPAVRPELVRGRVCCFTSCKLGERSRVWSHTRAKPARR